MKVRKYRIGERGIKIVHLSDLHNRPWENIIAQTADEHPNMIAVSGDITYAFDGYDRVGDFLAACARVAPTFLSVGNHDNMEDDQFVDIIKASDVRLLDNQYADIVINGLPLRIGGLSSPASHHGKSLKEANGREYQEIKKSLTVKTDWLDDFCDTERCKILLCHQPEYYTQFLSALKIDFILSGHAHGGQWRIGKQGVFAPGQGWFPKLTGGVHDGRLIVSRGLSNTTWIPRFFNPREIVVIEI